MAPLLPCHPAIAGAGFVALYEADPMPGLSASLRAFKYGDLRSRGRALCLLFAAAVADWAPAIDFVVPVASVPERQKTRGFNQAGWLACSAARALAVPCRTTLLKRRPGQAQARSSGAQRRSLHGQFYCPRQIFTGARVLLVDDVCTTGATAGDCAQALARAGAGSVHFACLLATPATRSATRIEPACL
ncbi:MAG: ComF family protein [Deltaproteobacteria bacterium]|nr:ComF family protein [Deltaproteobacteria bacterium]